MGVLNHQTETGSSNQWIQIFGISDLMVANGVASACMRASSTCDLLREALTMHKIFMHRRSKEHRSDTWGAVLLPRTRG